MLRSVSVAALGASAAYAGLVSEPELVAPWLESVTTDIDTTRIEVSVALRQSNMELLTTIVDEISRPGSPSYGQHLTGAQVRGLTKPRSEDMAAVVEWMAQHGVNPRVVGEGTNVVFSATPAEVEAMFATQIRPVANNETGAMKLRARDFTIPAEIENSVTAVYGLHGLPLPPRKASVRYGPAKVNPDTINDKYNVGGVQVSRGTSNRQAVAEFQGQNAKQSDLNKFFKHQVNRSDYQPGDEKIYKIIGTDGRYSGTEAALDIQYIMGVAPGIRTEFWGYPGDDFCKDMNDFTTQILGMDDVPNVFSVSYGYQGNISEIGCNGNDITTTNDNFKKIAARGISMIISSGDSGSQYQNRHLYPSWPASSPYVTAVGGTRFVKQDPRMDERATDQFGSGGGFSYDFDRREATWQEVAVQKYLDTVAKKPPSSYFHAKGRGTPDVSGIAEGYAVYSGGALTRVGGTSASAPMFAALVSLMNEARAARGKSSLGLLNPFLYMHPEAFFDVTLGTGAISRSGFKMAYGWGTSTGWDAATGLGTPHFMSLLDAALSV